MRVLSDSAVLITMNNEYKDNCCSWKYQINVFSKKSPWSRQAGEMDHQMLCDTQQVQIQCSAPGKGEPLQRHEGWRPRGWRTALHWGLAQAASHMWAGSVTWQQRRPTASWAVFTRRIAGTSWEAATVLCLALAMPSLSAWDKRLLRWLGTRKEAEVALVQHGEDKA